VSTVCSLRLPGLSFDTSATFFVQPFDRVDGAGNFSPMRETCAN